MRRQILLDADRVSELMFSLEVLASEDDRFIEDLTDAEIVEEAKFLLDKYEPGHGWRHAADLLGENGAEASRAAKRTVRQLERFIGHYGASKGA